MTKFIHLRTHTEYTLCSGAIKVKKFVGYLKEHKIPATAMTDRHVMFGVLEFSLACMKEGIQPIIGCETVLNINELIYGKDKKFFSKDEEINSFAKVILIAQTDEGYLNLMSLISNSYLNREEGVIPHVNLEDLLKKKNGLIILSGSIKGCFEKLLLQGKDDKAEEILQFFKENFKDHFYVELQRHGWQDEIKIEPKVLELAYKHNVPLVATNDCYFMKKDMFEAQDALSCIATGRYVTETDRERLTPEHYFKSEDEMIELFHDIPEAIENTVNIAKRISTMSYKRKPTLPHFPLVDNTPKDEKQELLDDIFPDYIVDVEAGTIEPKVINNPEKDKKSKITVDEAIALIKQSKVGLEYRLQQKFKTDKITDETEQQQVREKYIKQLKYELSVIIKMDFPGYFLIVADFIVWSKNNDVPIGPGRGSGAGSVVAWAMKITDLDPIKFSLFFERFLNPERVSMPDFDVDLCQRGRHRTIEYVQNKYGHEMVAQIVTFGKLQAKAVIKDVGRVLQMGYSSVDKISKMIPFNTELAEALEMDPDLQQQRKDDEQIDKLLTIALQLEGLNRHSSMHAAGVVIGDKPLELICPLFFEDGADMPVIQYTMKYAEETGLVKFDFLGLKTLTIIKDAVELVEKFRKTKIDISNIDLADQKVYDMLKEADSIAVFQIESTGMRGMLKQIKPDNIEDIIALISLFRPGPMDSIPTYIRRKHGLEEIVYPHEKVEKILKDTYGIIIYQEQVMDIAKALAGYTLGGADMLRRAMGKKIKEEMARQRGIFVEGCKKYSDIEADKANEIFDLLAKFAEYGFNKAHAAAYAVIGFQTAYLKRYFPVEFMISTINIEINDTDKINFYLEDIKKHNIKILPPDINTSVAYFNPEYIDIQGTKDPKVERYYGDKELAVRYGLGGIKGVGIDIMEAVVKERETNGKFKNIFDFCTRMGSKIVNKKTIESLSKSGAFDSIHDNRRQIFESCEVLSSFAKSEEESKNNPQMDLFGGATTTKIYPKLVNIDDWVGYERFQKEFEAFGFYLQNHPLDTNKEELYSKGITFLREALSDDVQDTAIVRLAGIVISTTIKSSDKGRYAFLSVSDPTGLIELSLFNNDLIAQRKDWLDDKQHMQLVFECTVLKKAETEPRFLIKDMWLLDEYLKNTSSGVEKVRYPKKKTFSSFNFKKKDGEEGGEVSGENKGTQNNEQIAVQKQHYEPKSEYKPQPVKIFEKINLTVESSRGVRELSELLNTCKKDNIPQKTHIVINTSDATGKTIAIELPDEYSIDNINFNRIRNIYGISNVEC